MYLREGLKESNREVDKVQNEKATLKNQLESAHERILELEGTGREQALDIKSLADKLRATELELADCDTVKDEKITTIHKLTIELEQLRTKLATAEDKNEILGSKVQWMTENLSSDKQESCNYVEAVNIKVSKMGKCITNVNKMCLELHSLLVMKNQIQLNNEESKLALQRCEQYEQKMENMIERFDKKMTETETKIDGSASY